MKHLHERGVIAIHILQEPLLRELWLGQGLCEGFDTCLHEVAVLGLITCAEEGFVRRPHLFFGGVHNVTTVFVEVEGQQENEKKRKLDGMESSKSQSNAHFMHG